MKYKEALAKSRLKRIIGVVISGVAILSTAISLLRMFYFRIDDGSAIGGAIARPFKSLVSLIYENTRFLDWFWENCPTPNFINLKDMENVYFLIIYLAIFVGFALYASGKKLSIRLAEIDKKIANQLIEESIQGQKARTRQEIENSAEVPRSSIFSQFHQLYLAPIITAIIGGIVIKLLGF